MVPTAKIRTESVSAFADRADIRDDEPRRLGPDGTVGQDLRPWRPLGLGATLRSEHPSDSGGKAMVTSTTESAGSQGVLKDDPSGQEAPSPAPAAGRRDLRMLSPEECLSLLEPGGVGRVGFMSGGRVAILPVNFAVAGKAIIFRTAPDTLLAAYGNAPVSFEADRLDEAHREGWSVLVQGHAHKVTSEHEVQRLEHVTHLEPWASGARDVYVRIMPARITGRIRRLVHRPGHGRAGCRAAVGPAAPRRDRSAAR
jgi:nitroimidazol reductase NimA-like FMN-containing flavoprotein (pyridoxamine 5'-phosphate oxidase superfamily)